MTRPCGKPTLRGPCARAAGHVDGVCLSVAEYADAIVHERSLISFAATVLERRIVSNNMRGLFAVVGPGPLRRSVLSMLFVNIELDKTAFAKAIAEGYLLEISPLLYPRVQDPRSLGDFVRLVLPQLGAFEDAPARIDAHLDSLRARKLGAAVIVVDDVAGLAHGLVLPEVIAWLRRRATEGPVVLGSTVAGWDRFRSYACSAAQGALVEEAREPLLVETPWM